MKELILKSPAKLNLYLDVLNKCRDGFHNILTLFERIDLFDRLVFKENNNGKINILCSDSSILQKDNLVYKVAKILKRDFSISKGVDIYIKKNIPISSGLGGGSSNAASCLLGLNRFWNLKCKKERLLDYARRIGSDVPFFINGRSFALGLRRGDRILPLDIKKRLWHVLIVPHIKVSTKEIYKRFKSYLSADRSSERRKKSLNRLILSLRKNIFFEKNLLFNALEKITQEKFKIVKKLKGALRDFKIKTIAMTGSGPAVFGIVSSRKEGERICRQLKDNFEDAFQIFLVKTF